MGKPYLFLLKNLSGYSYPKIIIPKPIIASTLPHPNGGINTISILSTNSLSLHIFN